jgi:excisionase family DNA binding protein
MSECVKHQEPTTTVVLKAKSDCPTLDDIAAKYGPTAGAQEVADLLGFHVDTVYNLVEKGRLRGYCGNGERFVRGGKRGKKALRIFIRSVEEFLAGFNARATEEAPPPVVEDEAPPPKVKKPQPSRGSRVVLPYPGQSRSATA